MDAQQIRGLQPMLARFLKRFDDCFARKDTRAHLSVYVNGQLSGLPRKSVEPIALAANSNMTWTQIETALKRLETEGVYGAAVATAKEQLEAICQIPEGVEQLANVMLQGEAGDKAFVAGNMYMTILLGSAEQRVLKGMVSKANTSKHDSVGNSIQLRQGAFCRRRHCPARWPRAGFTRQDAQGTSMCAARKAGIGT